MTKNIYGFEQVDTTCLEWQLSDSPDIGIQDRYGGEALAIAGADFNVFKLLGIHEQGALNDLTGNGISISGGTATGSSSDDVFNVSCKPWRSSQKGTDVLNEAYIGYNFGVPKLFNGRQRYGVDVDIKQHITTIRIQHGDNPDRRATKIRIERSDDGIKWLGVAIIDVPNNNLLNQISFLQSAVTRYWRLRPIEFTGSDTDFWEVNALQLIDWDETNVFQVQDDFAWIENRDRDYANTSITIKCFYDLYEKETDLTQFGFTTTGGLFYITCNFTDVVNRLGRPPVIGDILEVPGEAQYNPKMEKILKYLEVTDISWSAEGFAPGWSPTMLRLIAEPMLAKQETMDIVGDMVGAIDESGLFDLDESKYSELGTRMNDRGLEKAEQEMPQRGSDTADIRSYSQEEIQSYADHGINISKLSVNQRALYVEDAIPPNGKLYTEGLSFPDDPEDKAYHRLLFGGIADNIPARLFRYSSTKERWIFLETDLRDAFNPTKPSLKKIKESANAIPLRDAGKED